jgi:hypothetical protein
MNSRFGGEAVRSLGQLDQSLFEDRPPSLSFERRGESKAF